MTQKVPKQQQAPPKRQPPWRDNHRFATDAAYRRQVLAEARPITRARAIQSVAQRYAQAYPDPERRAWITRQVLAWAAAKERGSP